MYQSAHPLIAIKTWYDITYCQQVIAITPSVEVEQESVQTGRQRQRHAALNWSGTHFQAILLVMPLLLLGVYEISKNQCISFKASTLTLPLTLSLNRP